MNTSILQEPFDGISFDTPEDPMTLTANLTQQEIERGLDALHQALFRQDLPLVVLIEDDENEAELFRQALRDVGTAVEFMHFRDGNQALDFYVGKGHFSDRKRFPLPQLTVLDLHLNHRSGLEILQQIRLKPQLEQLVVVALTASDDVHEIEQARSLEIDDWVSKPNHTSDLIEIIRCLLRKWLPSAS